MGLPTRRASRHSGVKCQGRQNLCHPLGVEDFRPNNETSLLECLLVLHRQTCPNVHVHGQFGRCGRRRQPELHFWVWQYHQFRSIEGSIAIGPKQPTTVSVRIVRGATLWDSLYRPTRPQQTFMVVPHSSIRAGKTVLSKVPLMFVVGAISVGWGLFPVPGGPCHWCVVAVLVFTVNVCHPYP